MNLIHLVAVINVSWGIMTVMVNDTILPRSEAEKEEFVVRATVNYDANRIVGIYSPIMDIVVCIVISNPRYGKFMFSN